MTENDLNLLLTKYPDALTDRKMLVGILKDVFPQEQAKINLLLFSFDIGIVDEIKNNNLDELLAGRLISNIIDSYCIEKTAAEWSVVTWIHVYGQKILKKDFVVHGNVEYDYQRIERTRKKRIASAIIALVALLVVTISVFLIIFVKRENAIKFKSLDDGSCSFRLGLLYKVSSSFSVQEKYGDIVVTKIEDKAFKGKKNLKRVTISSSVRTLGIDAFKETANDLIVQFECLEKEGYDFLGWQLNNKLITGSDGIVTNKDSLNKGGVLSPAFAAQKNTVCFDGNGADNDLTIEQTILTDETSRLLQNEYQKFGYVFSGWSLSPEGRAVYSDEAEFKMPPNGSLTLFAVWTPTVNKVIFDGNGADSGIMDSISVIIDETINLPSNEFVRAGYQFVGWGVTKDGGANYDEFSDFIMEDDSTVVLYAIWEKGSYSISYDLAGGVDGGNRHAYDVDSDSFTLNNPTRTGYSFTGWTGTDISALSKTVTISQGSTGNRSYTAHWEANTNKVRFDANGGIGTMSLVNAKTDERIKLPACKFTRTGYKFVGWATSSGGKVVVSDSSNYTTGPKDITLYAVWEKESYSITYELNGGSVNDNRVSYYCDTDSFTLQNPTKKGYTFAGWIGTGLTSSTKTVEIPKGSSGNRSYTALWEANTNKIEFDDNGGTGTMAAISGRTDETVALPVCSFTRNGYQFAGWATSAGGKVVFNNQATITVGTEDSTLFAVWEKGSYSITYYLGGGLDNGNRYAYDVDTNTFSLIAPTRKGYTFLGWTGTGISTITKDVTVTKGSTGNRAYTAHWEANTNTIRFDANGGNGTMSDVSVKSDTQITLPKNMLSRSGYSFAGWSVTRNGSPTIEDQSSYAMETDSLVILYASWVIEEYSISCDFDGGNETSYRNTYNVETASFSLPSPQRTGYTFLGWTGSGITTPSAIVTITKGSTGNRQYKANWNINTYTITYALNGGTDPGNPSTFNIETNTFTLKTPTRDGYSFAGWSAGNQSIQESITIPKGTTGNREFSANWTIINYSIEYELNGGTATGLVLSYNTETDSFLLPIPQKTGYTFSGWSGTGLSSIMQSVTVSNGSTGNRSYTANWEANTNKLILTDGNNFVIVYGKTDSLVRIPKNKFVKDNKRFAGWSYAEGGEICFYDSDLFFMGTESSYTLFAVFEDASDTIVDRTGWIAISSPEDLFLLSQNPSSRYYLINDIDLRGYEWTPVRKFEGEFDGNGYSIYNITSKVSNLFPPSHFDFQIYYHAQVLCYGYGLIGNNYGKIYNLKIYNALIECNLTGRSASLGKVTHYAVYLGIISAVNNGTIENCYVNGSLVFSTSSFNAIATPSSPRHDGDSYLEIIKIGGITGDESTFATIKNCSADIIVNSQFGSRIGELYPQSDNLVRWFESDNYNSFAKGCIWYASINGSYRYQDAKIHSIVNVLDAFDEKPGYSFAGWSLTENGTVDYRPGDECYIPYEKTYLVLYPVWVLQ